MSVQVIPRSGYVSMPWKNGAGTTEEIARVPASGERFDWRLSLASIARSGPFSGYVGYRRSVTLIAGAGFQLDIAGQGAVVLDQVGKSCLFDGQAQTSCTLLGGPCRDLSLMVRSPGEILSVVVVNVGASRREWELDDSAHHALFVIGASPVRVIASALAEDSQLSPNDTLLIGPGVAGIVAHAANPAASLLWLSWRSL